MRGVIPAAMLLVAGLAACAPVPVERAEASCMRDAEYSQRPRTSVALGVGGGGGSVRTMGQVSVDLSSDYLMGRTPSETFTRCVQRRSGQLPTRPLEDQPGWRG